MKFSSSVIENGDKFVLFSLPMSNRLLQMGQVYIHIHPATSMDKFQHIFKITFKN